MAKPAAARLNHTAYPLIDGFRLAAALLVVAVHTSPLLSVNETADFILARVVARLAVPFFFMASGFFLVRRGGGGPPTVSRLAAFTKKLAVMYGICILLYLPLNLYAGYFSREGLAVKLLRDVLIDGTFYHLWYFPATILGVWVAWGLWRLLGLYGGLAVAGLLYLVGVGGDSWYGVTTQLPAIRGMYDALFTVSEYTRNGLFFAPLFLLLGILLAHKRPRHGVWFYAVGLFVAFDVMLIEALLLRSFGAIRHDSMYLALPFCAVFLFGLLRCKRAAPKQKYALLRRVSMLVYILHPWCIVLVRGTAGALKLTWLVVEVSPVFYLAVCAASLAAAFLLAWISNWWRGRGKRACQRAWAEVDESALDHNLAQCRALLPQGGEIMGVVKADAYGHGAVWVARALRRLGVRAFAVATAQEGVTLRRHGITGTILVLGYTPPELAGRLRFYRLTQTAVDAAHARALDAQGVKLRVHLKTDTGMHRLGAAANIDELVALYALPHLQVTGIFTHLSEADNREAGAEAFTKAQIRSFYTLVDGLHRSGIDTGAVHLQSSYGLLNYPGLPCHYARVGLALYGTLSSDDDHTAAPVQLRPVLALRARVASVRRVPAGEWVGYNRTWQSTQPQGCLVATITIGYGDGIPRHYPGGRVLLHGVSVPIIGRISMDQLSVLVDDVPGVMAGDVATLIGADGYERITAGEMAGKGGTITNDILAGLGSRVRHLPLPGRRKAARSFHLSQMASPTLNNHRKHA